MWHSFLSAWDRLLSRRGVCGRKKLCGFGTEPVLDGWWMMMLIVEWTECLCYLFLLMIISLFKLLLGFYLLFFFVWLSGGMFSWCRSICLLVAMPTQALQTDSSSTVEHSEADHQANHIDKLYKNLAKIVVSISYVLLPQSPLVYRMGHYGSLCHSGLGLHRVDVRSLGTGFHEGIRTNDLG